MTILVKFKNQKRKMLTIRHLFNAVYLFVGEREIREYNNYWENK